MIMVAHLASLAVVFMHQVQRNAIGVNSVSHVKKRTLER